MAKQKSSNARRANFEERGEHKYAAVTRQFAATQQLSTVCDAIKHGSSRVVIDIIDKHSTAIYIEDRSIIQEKNRFLIRKDTSG